MMNKVDNFEDAKIVIKNAPESEFFKHRVRMTKLRALFAGVVAAAGATIVGLVSNNPVLGMVVFPLNEMVLLPSIYPYLILKKAKKLSKDDNYLNTFSEQELIKMANDHIDDVNEYEENKDKPSEWGEKRL